VSRLDAALRFERTARFTLVLSLFHVWRIRYAVETFKRQLRALTLAPLGARFSIEGS
jgi:hypothetical protein